LRKHAVARGRVADWVKLDSLMVTAFLARSIVRGTYDVDSPIEGKVLV
jgi:hypothetical protein